MTRAVDKRLLQLGLTVPGLPPHSGSGLAYKQVGDLLHVSAQLPWKDGAVVTGFLGADMAMTEGQTIARLCALTLLAQIRAALSGDWSRLLQLAGLTVHLRSTSTFTQQAEVADAASDLLISVLGDKGSHARTVVSVAALPSGAAMSLQALVQVAPDHGFILFP